MTKLAEEVVTLLIDEYGRHEFLRRVSDPFWFQALGCVLGFDWHSSGVTTVVTAALKEVLRPEKHGLVVCGGKGRQSLKAPAEIGDMGEALGLSDQTVRRFRYASRLSAKVDNAAIQAGYQLYHHGFFLTEDGEWAVIQQGLSAHDRTARRYHWLSDSVEDFVVEPHSAIVGDVRRGVVLDMTAKQSQGCRAASADAAKEGPKRIARTLRSIRPACQRSLCGWVEGVDEGYATKTLYLPRRLNWRALRAVYELQPSNYEELLGMPGIGPATVRGLALIAELIHGKAPSWSDPVKFSFAFGGKDGVPFPVKRKEMDEAIEILSGAIEEARMGQRAKLSAIKRLRKFAGG